MEVKKETITKIHFNITKNINSFKNSTNNIKINNTTKSNKIKSTIISQLNNVKELLNGDENKFLLLKDLLFSYLKNGKSVIVSIEGGDFSINVNDFVETSNNPEILVANNSSDEVNNFASGETEPNTTPESTDTSKGVSVSPAESNPDTNAQETNIPVLEPSITSSASGTEQTTTVSGTTSSKPTDTLESTDIPTEETETKLVNTSSETTGTTSESKQETTPESTDISAKETETKPETTSSEPTDTSTKSNASVIEPSTTTASGTEQSNAISNKSDPSKPPMNGGANRLYDDYLSETSYLESEYEISSDNLSETSYSDESNEDKYIGGSNFDDEITNIFYSDDNDDDESLYSNAKNLKNTKYLNSLNVISLKEILRNNNLHLSKNGKALKKSEMIKLIKNI